MSLSFMPPVPVSRLSCQISPGVAGRIDGGLGQRAAGTGVSASPGHYQHDRSHAISAVRRVSPTLPVISWHGTEWLFCVDCDRGLRSASGSTSVPAARMPSTPPRAVVQRRGWRRALLRYWCAWGPGSSQLRLAESIQMDVRSAAFGSLAYLCPYLRGGLRPARTSCGDSCGCSQAAKWPPRSGWFVVDEVVLHPLCPAVRGLVVLPAKGVHGCRMKTSAVL